MTPTIHDIRHGTFAGDTKADRKQVVSILKKYWHSPVLDKMTLAKYFGVNRPRIYEWLATDRKARQTRAV